jgi:hypothetical protein
MTQFKKYTYGNTLLKSDYDQINALLDAKWKKAVNLEPGKTVYFDKNVQTSRTEFKKQYPDNKVIQNLSKADYYITNQKPSFWFNFNNGNQTVLQKGSWRTDTYLESFNKAIDFINGNISIVNPETIKFKAANDDLPQEMVAKIQQMLQSPDVETLNLGIAILFQYDHEKCLDQFYLLLAKANSRSWWRRKKTRVIEQKIKFIKSQFLNHRF